MTMVRANPAGSDPLETAAALGGFEILGLAGVVLGAASRRIPVMVDGFITAASALVAVRLWPKYKVWRVGRRKSREAAAKADASAVDVLAGQLARPQHQHRQGAPELAFEVEQAGEEVLEERPHRPVDMRLLAARRAIRPGQRRSTVEAAFLVGMPVGFPGLRFHRPRQQTAGHRVAECFDSTHQRPLLRILGALDCAC